MSEAAELQAPVQLEEVVSFLGPEHGQRYLDATLGLGGQGEAMLRKAVASGVSDISLLGLDRDASALALARERLAQFGESVHTANCPFSQCDSAVESVGWTGLDFILADIGVSSMQLDTAERGFSFIHDGPLDMRMDRSDTISA